jgi:CRISPR/Cas system endoribonuclease Cas6 (RAMP superfamily)
VYVLAGNDRDTHTRQAFTALSRFAALCGVGGQTSHGLGTVTVQTR